MTTAYTSGWRSISSSAASIPAPIPGVREFNAVGRLSVIHAAAPRISNLTTCSSIVRLLCRVAICQLRRARTEPQALPSCTNSFSPLHKRTGSFFGVFTSGEFMCHILLEAIPIAQVHEFNSIHRVFSQFNRQRTFPGDVLCERTCLSEQLVWRDNFLDNP